METGKEILDKYDERGVSRELIKELGLGNSMEQNLRELSGGELQRIAVAAAASKRYRILFFLMSHHHTMMFFQRTGVARVIQKFSKNWKERNGSRNMI